MSNTKELNDERGADYGHCLDHFNTTQQLYKVWLARRRDAADSENVLDNIDLLPDGVTVVEDNVEGAIRHAVYMIFDKLVRAAASPGKRDNWDDVGGYARCALISLGFEKYGEESA